MEKSEKIRESIENGDLESMVSDFKVMEYTEKLNVFKGSFDPDCTPFLTRVIQLIHCESHSQELGEGSPIQQLLSQIKPEDQLNILLTGDNNDSTPLHTACRHDDTETVKSILSSVQNEHERAFLLGMQTKDSADAPMHTAAMFSGKSTIECIIQSLSEEDLLQVISLKNSKQKTVLHQSVWNESDRSICVMLIKALLNTQDLQSAGRVFIIYT